MSVFSCPVRRKARLPAERAKMTGTIFDIMRYAIHDGPGIRTTVFFKGCPLNCWWCHNPESINAEPETICVRIGRDGNTPFREKKQRFGRAVTVGELMAEVTRDIIYYDQSGGGVTFSGGEPLLQPEFLAAALRACRDEDIHTAVDTSGHAPAEVLEGIGDLVDLFLYDLKLMDDAAHVKYTGVGNALILGNLERLAGSGSPVCLRIPMIPGVTDTDDNLDAIERFVRPLKNIRDISLLPYNKLGEDKREKFGLPNRLGKMSAQARPDILAKGRRFFARGYRVRVGG